MQNDTFHYSVATAQVRYNMIHHVVEELRKDLLRLQNTLSLLEQEEDHWLTVLQEAVRATNTVDF